MAHKKKISHAVARTEENVLLQRNFFLILGILSVLPWAYVYFFSVDFIKFMIGIDGNIIPNTVFLIELLFLASLIFFGYSAVLESAKPENKVKLKRQKFEIISKIFFGLFIFMMILFILNFLKFTL